MVIGLNLLKLVRTGRIKCVENGFSINSRIRRRKKKLKKTHGMRKMIKKISTAKECLGMVSLIRLHRLQLRKTEDFIGKVRIDLFGNQNKKTWASYNLEKEERVALKNFRKWNQEGSDNIIRIQSKSARLVIDSKERITQETERTLNDGKTFRKEEVNPTKDHIKKVKEWRDRWIEVFDDDEAIWLLNNEAKPATIYANPKTNKDGWPLHHIISCCGTAIENVAKWIEVHLRHLAKIHPTYIEDTRHFLKRIEEINKKYAPLPPTTLLIS